MSKELLKALTDVLDDLKLRRNLSEDDALYISDSVLMRAEKAIENYQEPNQDIISDIEYLITAFENGADADDYWLTISDLKEDLNTLKGQVTSQQIVCTGRRKRNEEIHGNYQF